MCTAPLLCRALPEGEKFLPPLRAAEASSLMEGVAVVAEV